MLARLAQESGIETPTAEDLARLDRKRKGKKLSNQDWVSKSDPEAKIAKMKDGTTHLAYKRGGRRSKSPACLSGFAASDMLRSAISKPRSKPRRRCSNSIVAMRYCKPPSNPNRTHLLRRNNKINTYVAVSYEYP